MTNPTTYFGWQMPEPTDLVTDLPADFEVFGQAVDTDLQDLLGGTTGQVLSKTSGTDLDFTWVDPTAGDITGVTAGTGISGGGTSGTVTVTNSMATAIDAKGDLIAGTADDTFDRLAVGANDTILTADSSTATGLKWAAPAAGGGKVLQVVTATTTTSASTSSTSLQDTNITATITPTLDTSKVLVLINAAIGTSKGSAESYGKCSILRDSTNILDYFTTNRKNIRINLAGTFNTVQSFMILDSPATTSSTTYKMQMAGADSTTVTFQEDSSISTITLLEIGA
jgi:hypothetical protein